VDDREFVSAFEACTLPPTEFHHRQHVRLAWLYLRDYPLLDALARFVEALKRFAAHHGASGKYHETITFAFLFLIHERMRRGSYETFAEFAAANGDLFGPLLERYYAPGVLSSEFARKTFVLPTSA
jgi:hypothetical protein